VMISLH